MVTQLVILGDQLLVAVSAVQINVVVVVVVVQLCHLRRRANARNVSFRISLRWPIHIINQLIKPNYYATNIFSSINNILR